MESDPYASSSSMSYSTYDFARAQETSAANPDKIYYDKDFAFRNQDYRQLYHQDGTIGTFSVRLLEASGLSRRYWSALALGPMKHLGLSKAHGGVSSFVSICLDTTATISTSPQRKTTALEDVDRKLPAKVSSANQRLPYEFSEFVSPVVQNTNNPVWTNCQFEIPLRKGALEDGQPVRIALRVDEDATAVENMIPGIPSAGGVDRLLGIGHLDVTSLCLGQDPATGRPAIGVLDTWVPIGHSDEQEQEPLAATGRVDDELLYQKKAADGSFDKKEASFSKKKNDSFEKESREMGGRVRVLVTYQPHGMNPKKNDVVALEAFARQNTRTATCNSILPPMIPMHVVKVSEPWLLVQYWAPYETNHHGSPDYNEAEAATRNKDDGTKSCMRLHRNAVFVIERKNLLDGTLNLALQPAEFILSTPLGQSTCELLEPVFVASKKVLMPALLTSKLVWMAVKTTAVAGFTGMHSAGTAFVNEGTTSLTEDGRRRPSDVNRRVRYV